MLYKEWLSDWLENYVKTSVKERTYAKYADIVRIRLIPALGKYELNDLTPFIVQRYITELLHYGNLKNGEGLSANTVNLIIAVIQSSMETAHSIGLTDEYKMNKIKRPRVQEKQISCFSPSEQKTIEQAVLTDKRGKMIGILICLYTGLRVGELLALEWTDIDFSKNELKVCKTCYDKGRSRITTAPKTTSSVRVIPIPKQLVPILKQRKKQSKSQYVISQNGAYILVRSYQRSFELLLKRLGIAHQGFHSLRHTFATRALECGMDVKTLSEILGHKNATITLNRYAHSLMDHKREMMNRLGKLI